MKRFILWGLVALALCLSVTSCRTYYSASMQPEYQSRFVGATYQQIVNSLGMPTRTQSDGAGGTILAYENTTYNSIQTAYNVNHVTGTYTPGSRTTQNTSYVYLYMNKNNVCYNVKTNHRETRSKYSPGKTAGLICSILIPIAALIGLITYANTAN